MIEAVDLVIVGCGPAGATAAREAARAGRSVVVLEKDRTVGEKRVCAAGLRPGFCATFDLPESLVHCDTPRLALFDAAGKEHEIFFGPGHTTTREELDGTIAQLAQREGAEIRTSSLFRGVSGDGAGTIVEYATPNGAERKQIRAKNVFFAQGSTAKLESHAGLRFEQWERGLMTTLQYRVYLERPAAAIAYQTLELHYYTGANGRQIIAWMFPKRDHLAIGLGFLGKMPGASLREELDAFTGRVERRLYPGIATTQRTEGHLLYGGLPRPHLADGAHMVGGTAAGFVDATNGEGIFEAAMSGRFAAEAVVAHPGAPLRAASVYAERVRKRFERRLKHRVSVMRFLEERPKRYGVLFEHLANDRRFADILQREEHERRMIDRIYLYAKALMFAAQAARV